MRDMAMTDIIETINESELAVGNKKEKEKQDQATAEEMRTKATDRLGQTRRRHSEESEDGELAKAKQQRCYGFIEGVIGGKKKGAGGSKEIAREGVGSHGESIAEARLISANHASTATAISATTTAVPATTTGSNNECSECSCRNY